MFFPVLTEGPHIVGQKKTNKGKVRPSLMTFLRFAMWKARGEEKTPTYCKSSVGAPLSVSMSLSHTHAGPCPGSLGKCQAVDWQRMKACGRRRGWSGRWGGGVVSGLVGAEERRF